ncbi:hypothetical protein HN499_02475 [archaeon]|jgi:hypothetical protein|nr:hypothetical protein [archaeon]
MGRGPQPKYAPSGIDAAALVAGDYSLIGVRKLVLSWYKHFTDFIQDPKIISGISEISGEGEFEATNSFAQNHLKPFNRDYPLLREEALAIERGERRRRDLLNPDLALAVLRLFTAEMRIKSLLEKKD